MCPDPPRPAPLPPLLVDPGYNARTLIPLLGMVLGNTISSVGAGLSSTLSELVTCEGLGSRGQGVGTSAAPSELVTCEGLGSRGHRLWAWGLGHRLWGLGSRGHRLWGLGSRA